MPCHSFLICWNVSALVSTARPSCGRSRRGSGLLIEREHQRYSFAHLTFQEYLAATHILEQKLEQELVSHTAEIWWHETIRLYVAQTDATAIVNACITSAAPSIEALTLAIDAKRGGPRAPARRPDPPGSLPLTQGVEDTDHERRRLDRRGAAGTAAAPVGPAGRSAGDRYEPAPAAPNTSCSSTSAPRRARFTSLTTGKTPNFQPDRAAGLHWVMRPSDAATFCAWLTRRSGGASSYRLPRRDELPRDASGDPQLATQADGLICWSRERLGAYINL